jgi:hypothetical protein
MNAESGRTNQGGANFGASTLVQAWHTKWQDNKVWCKVWCTEKVWYYKMEQHIKCQVVHLGPYEAACGGIMKSKCGAAGSENMV